MDIFRKPATAEWYYDSAQKVDSVEFPSGYWTGQLSVTFDGTKDKTGERHTTTCETHAREGRRWASE